MNMVILAIYYTQFDTERIKKRAAMRSQLFDSIAFFR